MSRRRVDNLGERLTSGPLSETDEQLFREFITYTERAMTVVEQRLRDDRFSVPTPRLKNRETIKEKMVREGFKLSKVQDLVGCRFVLPRISDRIDQGIFVHGIEEAVRPLSVRRKDRTTDPSHGYRAIHLLIRVLGIDVEIQVRTARQHAWAETNEKLGDLLGRGIRYGEGVDLALLPPEVDQLAAGVQERARGL